MGYIPQHSLENLKKYSYKGVDKCVIRTVARLFSVKEKDWRWLKWLTLYNLV